MLEHTYTEKQIKEIRTRAKYLEELLSQVDAKVIGFDPGVMFDVNVSQGKDGYGTDTISFSGGQWEWIEPILKDAIEYRKTLNENNKK